jgi:XTP/dITP diphosphohydrolase
LKYKNRPWEPELRLYCATTNPGKLREFQSVLAGSIAVESLPGLAGIPVCEETGATFEENAIQKAIYYSRFCDGPVFVDDSGIEVDALDGAPGVFSARFAGPDASDEANNRLLLDKMKDISDRNARFVCVVALAESGKVLGTFRGDVEGELLTEPRGHNGFGYDPLFYYPPFGRSFGEVAPEKKMVVSHRGKALRAMLAHFGAAAST